VEIRVKLAQSSLNPNGSSTGQDMMPKNDAANIQTFQAYKKNAERAYLQNLMKEANHSIKEACKNSNLSRSRLHALLKIHNISKFY
jgi:transcriptional regulator of acetoin/glycerol metabolism